MPRINHWFQSPKEFQWERANNSLIDSSLGPDFFTYPAWWLLPRIHCTYAEIAEAPSPLWIVDIDENSEVGTIDERGEGTFIISLAQSFDEYISSLSYDYRKKFRAVLRHNEDVSSVLNRREDVEALWPFYESRIQELNLQAGEALYTESDLALRKELYTSTSATTISLMLNNVLIGVNVGIFGDGYAYDLASLISPDPQLRKRSLGTLATLRNIEEAIARGVRKYDFLTGNFGYKTNFGAKEKKLKHFIRCSRSFAESYSIPLHEVHQLVE